MGDRTCSLPGCGRPHRCRGLCGAHYYRWRATGSTGSATIQDRTLSIAERFWARVDASGDCWVWTASCDHKGYGQFSPGGGVKTQRAHRWAWEHLVGPIPDRMVIDHLCRVRRCVNPDHLRITTSGENTACSPIALAAVAARKTHCTNGHQYTPENTYLTRLKSGNTGRSCRQCHIDLMKRKRKQAHALP